MRRMLFLAVLFLSGLAMGQAYPPCVFTNVPMQNNVQLITTNFGNLNTGGFATFAGQGELGQLIAPCYMSGKFRVWVQTADTNGTTNQYNLGLTYNSGSQGIVGGLYSTTGQFNGTVLGATGPKDISAVTTTLCPAYPCLLPAGVYSFDIATNATASNAVMLGSNVNTVNMAFAVKQTTGYSGGFPATLAGAPIAVSPVQTSVQPTISILVW